MNLKLIHNVFFIGIGGIGMSALARYFVAIGKTVAGYDKTATALTSELMKSGVKIYFEEEITTSNLDTKKTLIIYTPAISEENNIYQYFKNNDFTLLKRAEILGLITENSFCLAVAGTHGKTTTSAILGHILQPEKVTAFLGGISENYQSNLILGDEKSTVVEADEFDRSFLKLSPNIACITSMDADHLDIYKNQKALQKSFLEFSQKVSDALIYAKRLPLNGLNYAIEEEADYCAKNVKILNGTYVFDVQTPTETLENFELHLPGRHNIMNALAAIAMADNFGVSLEKIKTQIESFKGVKRRFSYQIKTDDLVLIDDYAHHPTAIKAIEESVREMYPKEKILVVFQPHLYSRTQDFADEFASSLSNFDEIVLLDIYPARELPILGVTSEWLLAKMNQKNSQLTTKKTLVKVVKKSSAKIIVMLGAGDIGTMVEEVKKELLKKK